MLKFHEVAVPSLPIVPPNAYNLLSAGLVREPSQDDTVRHLCIFQQQCLSARVGRRRFAAKVLTFLRCHFPRFNLPKQTLEPPKKFG